MSEQECADIIYNSLNVTYSEALEIAKTTVNFAKINQIDNDCALSILMAVFKGFLVL